MKSGSFDRSAHAARMRSAGWWADRTLDARFVDAAARHPDKPAVVAYRADRPGAAVRRLSYAELGEHVGRAAFALRDLGVAPGDVVSVQLPNWWEFVVVALACGRIGAVVNPLMPILRERELSYMLEFCAAKVLVVPPVFRGFDHAAMARGLQARLPALRHVVVAGGDETAADSFARLLLGGAGTVEPPGPMHPDDLAVLMFTSGTTGEPKGVMHSSNTIGACIDGLARRFGLTDADVLLACSPFGHMTGYTAVMLQALCIGSTVVLQDLWDPKTAVRIMADEGVTHTAAATTFLSDIVEAVAAGGPRPRLRTFLCGGAPIPPVSIERALRELEVPASSLWGMTETLGGTLTEPERAHEKSASTDGRPLDGLELRVVDDGGAPLPAGTTGRLMVRGATLFLGYYKRPDLAAGDLDGWFDSGDLAYMDDEGYLRINGRTKDVLIRGGENVPVFEIESLLYKHPSIAAAAVVGMPDVRLGERGCAFVVLRAGCRFDLDDLRAYMAECQVTKAYWPERVEVIDAMPTTASGKIRKFELRERAARLSA